MFLIVKEFNGKEVYRATVESLVNQTEQGWYANVYTKGLPSMKEINDSVNLNRFYSFEGFDNMGYAVSIKIEKEM